MISVMDGFLAATPPSLSLSAPRRATFPGPRTQYMPIRVDAGLRGGCSIVVGNTGKMACVDVMVENKGRDASSILNHLE